MFKRIVNVIEILALVGAVVFVVMLFANEPGGGGSASGGGSTGQQLFAENCATCHGADGQGAVGPQLAGRVTQRFPNIDDQIALGDRRDRRDAVVQGQADREADPAGRRVHPDGTLGLTSHGTTARARELS